MDTFKEQFLRILAEKREEGLLPKLTEEEQKRAEVRIDAQIKKLRKILEEAGVSVGDSLRRFAGFLEDLSWKKEKPSDRAMKRHRRQRELAQRTGRRNRKGRKRFR